MGRARDDLDMERALRPRINAPDVVRSTLSHKELKYNESTIDQLLGTPNKIVIPERYIPEQVSSIFLIDPFKFQADIRNKIEIVATYIFAVCAEQIQSY